MSGPTTAEDVVVAVLSWRGEAATRRCLTSLRALSPVPRTTVVVDNASGTGEGERLATEFGVEALTLESNGGVAAGYNAAIRLARERDASFVLLLNNDVTVQQPDLLGRMRRIAASASVAAVGPIVRDADGSTWSAGGRGPTLGHVRHLNGARSRAPYAVDWLDGSVLFVSVAAACAAGGLSEEFFLYWEEVDWCTRLRRAGFRLLVDPGAEIVHERGATVPRLQTRRYALRNSLLFLRRNARGTAFALGLAAWAFGRVPLFLVRVTASHGLRAAVGGLDAAIGWNFRDARRRGLLVAPTGPRVCE